MAGRLKMETRSVGTMHTIIIHNNGYKREFFRSNDISAFKAKQREMSELIKKDGYVATCISLYKYAKEYGCTVVEAPRDDATVSLTARNLRIRNTGSVWILLIVNGKQEVDLMNANNLGAVKAKYLEYMKSYTEDPMYINWLYTKTLHKQEVSV